MVFKQVRSYPAARIVFSDSPTEDAIDRVLAVVDECGPTALEEHADGVQLFFANAVARDAALSLLADLPHVTCVAREVPDAGWAERSQASIGPVTVGRLTIAPPWSDTPELRAQAPGPVIIIQPSMGFGTGHHASTRLCLGGLQSVPLAGRRVLDVGTGSGVLAIAASLVGGTGVVGIDVDPDALENARENLAFNDRADVIDLRPGDAASIALSDPTRIFDVILANLTGALLVRDAPVLTSLAAAGAHLIVSGYQLVDAAGVMTAFGEIGWTVEHEAQEQTWLSAVLRRA